MRAAQSFAAACVSSEGGGMEAAMFAARSNYQDSVFRHLYGSPERKAEALELYNALAGTSHDDPDEMEITTIEDFIFLGRKNDVSFLVGDEMVLWEHQSTHNPNMPLRGLLYLSRLYEKHVATHGIDLYSPSPAALPTPHYFVLYFGERERREREVMLLSDLFASGPGDLEVRATVLNCNEGHNGAIMRASRSLRGYAHLMALVRAARKAGAGTREAVAVAVDQCIRDGYLVEYLTAHKAEVTGMLFTIEDEERAMRVHRDNIARLAREEGYADGRTEGYADGRTDGYADGRTDGYADGRTDGYSDATLAHLRSVMASTGCDAGAAMDILQVPAADRAGLASKLG